MPSFNDSLRLGMAFASPEIVGILNKIKPPYNLSGLTQQTVIGALNNLEKKDQMVAQILANREILKTELEKLPIVKRVYFILAIYPMRSVSPPGLMENHF